MVWLLVGLNRSREGPYVRNARQRRLAALLVEDVCTSSVSRTHCSRSGSRFTFLPATTLAHRHRQPRSTTYCSRTSAFSFPERPCILTRDVPRSPFEDPRSPQPNLLRLSGPAKLARLLPARAAFANVVCDPDHVKRNSRVLRKKNFC
jgi:hypothetical protein